jgi:hypothetical protein
MNCDDTPPRVVSLAVEREKRQPRPDFTGNVILDALDLLGLALVEHGHTWSDRERQLYEDAVAMVGGK